VSWHSNAQLMDCGFRLRAVPATMMRLLQTAALDSLIEIERVGRPD
jgi:hypothetical protein